MKRIISRKEIEKAYKKEVEDYQEQLTQTKQDKIEQIPEEMFQILGKVISFIESKDKIEGEKNENKS